MRNRRSLAAGLSVGGVTTANRCDGAGGRCDQSEPGGGCLGGPGQAVDLVVSLGPAPGDGAGRGGPAAGDSRGGDRGGRPERSVLVTTANSATVPAGDVISQNPAAGASVDELGRRWTWWCRWVRRR